MIYLKLMLKKALLKLLKKMIKAIFFDSGNVLVKEGFTPGIATFEKIHGIESGKLYIACHDHQYWKDFSLGKISEAEYFNMVKKNYNGDLDIKELKEVIMKNFISNFELIEYLKTIKDKYILGVISNNPKEWFEYCEKKFGWKKLFSIKAVSGYLHIRKPEVKIFQTALDEANIAGAEAIYIDDRPDRIEGAKSLGIKIVIYENINKLLNDLKILNV